MDKMEIKNMFKNKTGVVMKLAFALLLLNLNLLTACAQKDEPNSPVEPVEEVVKKHTERHPFGGWYCPDNLDGLPAVNLDELDQVLVVNGRMPTREETRNGTSLMYFDPVEYPDAKPMDMKLPRLARYQSEITNKNELVIIIEAIDDGGDGVVGFRYLNGGNGTSWIEEVEFLSDEEVEALGPMDFVTLDMDIKASKAKIWDVIMDPASATTLGKRHDEPALTHKNWPSSTHQLTPNLSDPITNRGEHPEMFGNRYIQMDYSIGGFHYVEKFLMMENEDEQSGHLKVVAGPFSENIEAQQVAWEEWIEKVKTLCEKE